MADRSVFEDSRDGRPGRSMESALPNIEESKKLLRVLVVGAPKTGKTSVIQQFLSICGNTPSDVYESEYTTTLEVTFYRAEYLQFRVIFLIWEVGGFSAFHSIEEEYYASVDVVLVFCREEQQEEAQGKAQRIRSQFSEKKVWLVRTDAEEWSCSETEMEVEWRNEANVRRMFENIAVVCREHSLGVEVEEGGNEGRTLCSML